MRDVRGLVREVAYPQGWYLVSGVGWRRTSTLAIVGALVVEMCER